MTPGARMKINRKLKLSTSKAIILAVLLQLIVQEARGEHWPNYWSPINHGDEVISPDDRTNHPAPPVDEPVVDGQQQQRNREAVAGLIGRRQLYLENAKKRPIVPLNRPPAAAAPAIVGYNHPIPESNNPARLPAETPAATSDWVPMQADPMKGDPLFEYNPPALQTVKLGEFQAESEEEQTLGGASPLLQAYSNSLDPASLLLASTLMLNNPLADDAIDRSDVGGDDESTAFIDDESHPYYGAGRIKVAMDDPNSKERLPFTSNQASNLYSLGNPSLRRTTILPLSNGKEITNSDELVETTTATSSEQKITKLVYQAPPRRIKTTEQPPAGEEEDEEKELPTGEESLLSFLQNWLQASSPEQPKPTPAYRATTTTKKVTALKTTSTTPTSTTPAVPATDETVAADEEVTAPATTETPATQSVPKFKLEQRNRFPVHGLERTTNRPSASLRFPTEKTTKSPFASVQELAHAVRPVVSNVPFIIVQGHSKVKMYGVNTLESSENEKHLPGSKAQLEDKIKPLSIEELEHDSTPASTESEEIVYFNRDAAVERPIATKQPRPQRPQQQFQQQQQQNRRPPPADFRFPNQKKGGGKRPQGAPLRNGPPPRPQLRPAMRPVFFTKRNPSSGSPSTHSNAFEYFSQLARLTASRIKPTPAPEAKPLTPRSG